MFIQLQSYRPAPRSCFGTDRLLGPSKDGILKSMSGSVLDVEAAALADWLAQQAGDRLWTVDGEPRLAGALRLPCLGRDLAATLKSRGGRLRVFGPQGAQASSAAELSKLADKEDGGLAFEVAWLSNGTEGEHWVLAEDTLAEEAERAAS
jgi:hypothetical protein